MPAGGPHTQSVNGAGATTTLKDIMIGDVYLCAGQSNTAFPVRLSTGAWTEFPANPDLRFVNTQRASQRTRRPAHLNRPVAWTMATPKTVGEALAACYYMARTLQQKEKVPVGFIGATWGATTIEGWIGASSLSALPDYAGRLEALADKAANPAKAMADEARRHEQWWHAHDPQAKAQRAWRTPQFDDAAWPNLLPQALADFEGAAWYRTSVTPTEAQAANAVQPGPIDTYDSTWVNGVRVGGGSIAWVWRDYAVPAGVFKPGHNVIAIRVLTGSKGGGLTG